MLESFAFRLSIECHGCRIPIPLNGVVPATRCYHCGEVNQFKPSFWLRALSGPFQEAFGVAPGVMQTTGAVMTGLRVEFGRRAPQCQRCKGPDVALDQIVSSAERGECGCPGCGEGVSVRRADDTCIAINSGARYVVNEQAPDAEGRALQARTKPVVFACMSCGGSLQVDGSSRLVTCKFCSADNYLPDGLWQLLNPVPKPEVFFFVCEYENEVERAARASRETPGVLASLAKDSSVLVRCAVAANPATPAATLEQLAFDRIRAVLEALASNPNLPSELVDEMAHSANPEFRALAARHPRLSPGQLPGLARQQQHTQARDTAAMRLADLQARGVVVEEAPLSVPKKGFFSRLFGD